MVLRSFTLNLSVLLLGGLLFVSCNKQITPDVPLETYDTSKIDSLKKEVSYITLPIELQVKNIEDQINQQFSGLIYDDNSFKDDDLKLKIWKQDNIRFRSKGQGVFEFEVPLKIWVEKQVKVLGLSQTPATQFEIVTKFSSKPYISSQWELKTLTNAEGFRFISEPKLHLAGISIPITSIVSSILDNYQASIARMIDETVSKQIDIKRPVLEVWNKLKEPNQVSTEYNIWTQVEPQDVLMTELITNDKLIRTSVAIKAIINSSVGKSNIQVRQSTELPPLKFVNSLPSGFGIYLYNLITFSEAEKIVNQLYRGEKYSFTGGRQIDVLGVKIYGGDKNKLVIQIMTSGDLRGTIFLKGDPVYDIKRRELVLRNTEFDLKTRDILKKAAVWAIEGNLEKSIENDFGIPVDPIFEMAKSSVDEFFNTDFKGGFKLTGGVKEILPLGVSLQPEGLMTTVEIKGNLGIRL